MKPIQNTKFLEAVAASIQHEKDKFDFYNRVVDSSKNESIRNFFLQLAEEVDEHIRLIQEIYNKSEGLGEFPNLKQLNPIHKFHTSNIAKLMKRLDRTTIVDVGDDELKTFETTLKEEEDVRKFYSKLASKFKDPKIKLLFQKLANFSEENMTLIESHFMFLKEKAAGKENYYWDDEELMSEAAKGKPFVKAASKPAAKKKSKK
jgi:rubrerythrin